MVWFGASVTRPCALAGAAVVVGILRVWREWRWCKGGTMWHRGLRTTLGCQIHPYSSSIVPQHNHDLYFLTANSACFAIRPLLSYRWDWDDRNSKIAHIPVGIHVVPCFMKKCLNMHWAISAPSSFRSEKCHLQGWTCNWVGSVNWMS